MSYFRDQLEKWLKTIDSQGVVFDVGGGAWPIKERVRNFDANKYVIFDKGIEKTNQDYVYLDVNLPWKEDLAVYEHKADQVFMLEVMEYVYNPIQALQIVNLMLKDDGEAFVSWPFVYPLHEPVASDYLRYTENGVYKIVREAGLEVEQLDYRVDRSGILEKFYRADGMHPAKGFKHSTTGFLTVVKKSED